MINPKKYRKILEYNIIKRLDINRYDSLYTANDIKKNESVILKEYVKKDFLTLNGFSLNIIREIKLLRIHTHPNIIKLLDIILGSGINKIYLSFERMETNLKDFIGLIDYNKHIILLLFKDLIQGLVFLHDNNLIHRDIKPSNLLITSLGVLKISDFGISRESSVAMTPNIGTLYYRAPETLLGNKKYDSKIDVWAAGCVLAEMWLKHPLFKGKNEIEQMHKIKEILCHYESYPIISSFEDLKTNPKLINILEEYKIDKELCQLIEKLLIFAPNNRFNATEIDKLILIENNDREAMLAKVKKLEEKHFKILNYQTK